MFERVVKNHSKLRFKETIFQYFLTLHNGTRKRIFNTLNKFGKKIEKKSKKQVLH